MNAHELFPNPTPAIDERDLSWLIDWLADRDWTHGAEILRSHGLPVAESTLRTVRTWASSSGGRIASGQKGYKLTKAMTKEEFDLFHNTMASQAREMLKRAEETRRIFYHSPTPTFPVLAPIPAAAAPCAN